MKCTWQYCFFWPAVNVSGTVYFLVTQPPPHHQKETKQGPSIYTRFTARSNTLAIKIKFKLAQSRHSQPSQNVDEGRCNLLTTEVLSFRLALVLLGSGKQMMNLPDNLTTSSSSQQKHAHTELHLCAFLRTRECLLKRSEYPAILRLNLTVCVLLSQLMLKEN